MQTAIALIMLAQASQPWLVPSQSYEPYPSQPQQPRQESTIMLDGQGRQLWQPFNTSGQWPAYVEPVTPDPSYYGANDDR